LTGARLADCAHSYFRQSEPMETVISLAADLTGKRAGASALMIQRLASDQGQTITIDGAELRDHDDDWRRAAVLTSSATPKELLDPTLEPSSLLYRLYHEDGVRLFRTREIRHACSCSNERVAATLSSFPPDEIDSMVEDGRIAVTCEFCQSEYKFEGKSLSALYPS
jgi:molecular chaperone Hsp33